MIKVKPRARVSEEFLSLYREVANARLREIFKKLRALKPARQADYLKQYRISIGRLKDIIAEEQVPGKGMDLEITRFRAMPYISFGVERDSQRETYLVGHTTDVLMNNRWEAGQYKLAVPYKAALNGNLGDVQMIPLKDPFTYGRHPHHTAAFRGETNPLDMSCGTCWGSFGTTIMHASNESNLTELFRLLRIFLDRYDPHSPLTTTWPHMKDTKS